MVAEVTSGRPKQGEHLLLARDRDGPLRRPGRRPELASLYMEERGDLMPDESVTVVNPESWSTRPHQLAPLLAAAGRSKGSRVVPDTSGAPAYATILIGDPSYWSGRPPELAEALAIAATDMTGPSVGVGSRGAAGAAPGSPDRLTLTVEEAAAVLGISRAFAYEAVRRGDVPAIKIGRRILVPRAALNRMLGADGVADSTRSAPDP